MVKTKSHNSPPYQPFPSVGEVSQMFKQYGRICACRSTWRPWERNHVCTPSVSQFQTPDLETV